MTDFARFDPARVPSPCYVVDRAAIERNLQILQRVQQQSGAKVLLALKAFSMFSLAPLVMKYLDGTCASGLHEARLGREEYGGEVHVFGAAYTRDDLAELVGIADHLVFNSFGQWQGGRDLVEAAQKTRHLEIGLRINPQHSEGTTPIYDPSAPRSRLGIPRAAFAGQSLDGISGLHFHNLCEQDFPPLERTFAAVEARFGDLLPQMRWLNLGGGHHITRDDYQVDDLIAFVRDIRERYGVEVILEPGEAIALNAGVFVTEVLDLTDNDGALAILDSSATAHMPDTLEMPYRAHIIGSGEPGEKPYAYRLGGQTCLAGDVMGDYAFDAPLNIGDRLMFTDMAIYTMVKTTTFNGIRLPSIAIWDSRDDSLDVVRNFGYDDFKTRLS